MTPSHELARATTRRRWTPEEIAIYEREWDHTASAHANAQRLSKIIDRDYYTILWRAERDDLTNFNLRDPHAPDPVKVRDHAAVAAIHGGFPSIVTRRRGRTAPALAGEGAEPTPNRFRHLHVIEGGKAQAIPHGVEVIRTRPVEDRHVRWARQQLACGMSLDEFAITFRLDSAALARSLMEGAA